MTCWANWVVRKAAQSSHWQHATHPSQGASPRGLPCARDDAIAASLDSTGREDEVLRSLRLTAVLRTLSSRSSLPLHLVKLQANSTPVYFSMRVSLVNSGAGSRSHNTHKKKDNCAILSWWTVKGVAVAAVSIHQLNSSSLYCWAALWCHRSLGDPTMWSANWKVIACCTIRQWKCCFLFKTN